MLKDQDAFFEFIPRVKVSPHEQSGVFFYFSFWLCLSFTVLCALSELPSPRRAL